MVATGWVWSEHMTEERVHFPERERESSKEKLREAEELRARIQERVKRGCPSIYSRPFRDLPMVVLTN